MALTATATPQVQEDICTQLGLRSPLRLVGHPDRPNLVYRAHPRAEGARQILDVVRRYPGQGGIVYALTRKDTERIAEALQKAGVDARPYHAGMDAADRAKRPGRLRQRAAAGGRGDDRLRHGDRPLERALRRPRAPAALARALPAGIGARRARRAAGRVRAAGERRGSLPPQADGAAGRPAARRSGASPSTASSRTSAASRWRRSAATASSSSTSASSWSTGPPGAAPATSASARPPSCRRTRRW